MTSLEMRGFSVSVYPATAGDLIALNAPTPLAAWPGINRIGEVKVVELPDGLRPIVDDYLAGRREEAVAGYARWLPLINYENRQCGLLAAKALMKEGGVIRCDAPRHPITPMHPATRAGLLDTAKRLDPLVLRWG